MIIIDYYCYCIVIEDLHTGDVYDTSIGHDHGVLSHVVFLYHDSLLYAKGPLQQNILIKVCLLINYNN